MKIEESSVEFITEPNILKKIELAGRTCYNSQNLITDDSYKKFIKNIMDDSIKLFHDYNSQMASFIKRSYMAWCSLFLFEEK